MQKYIITVASDFFRYHYVYPHMYLWFRKYCYRTLQNNWKQHSSIKWTTLSCTSSLHKSQEKITHHWMLYPQAFT